MFSIDKLIEERNGVVDIVWKIDKAALPFFSEGAGGMVLCDCVRWRHGTMWGRKFQCRCFYLSH